MIAATVIAIQGVERELIWSARNMGASNRELLRQIVLPAACPQIMTGLQVALPLSLIVAVVAEMLMGGYGLGGAMMTASRFANSTGVFAGIVEIAVVGYCAGQGHGAGPPAAAGLAPGSRRADHGLRPQRRRFLRLTLRGRLPSGKKLPEEESMTVTRLLVAAAIAVAFAGTARAAQYLQPTNAQRSYGAGVVTEGGRIVWLAGMGGTKSADGKTITDFAEQTRQAFRNIEKALKQAGGSLENLVSMTVMIRNQADGDTFVKVRGEFFKSKFPASMLITAKDFANPDLMVEIQSVAVIGDQLR